MVRTFVSKKADDLLIVSGCVSRRVFDFRIGAPGEAGVARQLCDESTVRVVDAWLERSVTPRKKNAWPAGGEILLCLSFCRGWRECCRIANRTARTQREQRGVQDNGESLHG